MSNIIKTDPLNLFNGANFGGIGAIKKDDNVRSNTNLHGTTNFFDSKVGNLAAQGASFGLNFANSFLTRNDSHTQGNQKVNLGTNITQSLVSTAGSVGKIAKIGSLAKIGNMSGGPWGAVAQGAGKLIGNLIGGKDRIRGTGSAITSGVASVASMFGPIGWAASAVLEGINGAGIGQKRIMKAADFSNEFGSGYTGSALDVNRDIAMYAGKKAGTFDFNLGKRGQRAVAASVDKTNKALSNVNLNKHMLSNVSGDMQAAQNDFTFAGHQPQLILHSKNGVKIHELEAARELLNSWGITKFKDGGVIEKNVIPVGSLHKNKHHIEEARPELTGQITEKGIPVVSSDVAENVRQFAEIEAGEITFTKTVTDQLEEFYKKYKEDESDELAIELGKFLVEQILHNTIDKDKIIKKTE